MEKRTRESLKERRMLAARQSSEKDQEIEQDLQNIASAQVGLLRLLAHAAVEALRNSGAGNE